MLRTLAINSNKKCVKFWCFDSFFITKAIWDWGEFFGIHARNIPGQDVRIYHRREPGPHMWIGVAPGCRHLHPIAAHFPPQMFTSGILMPDGKGERFNFSGYTYPDHLIASTRMGEQPFCTVLRCSPEASWYLPPIFWDILRYFIVDILCLNS